MRYAVTRSRVEYQTATVYVDAESKEAAEEASGEQPAEYTVVNAYESVEGTEALEAVCQVCGEAFGADPAGSPGVLVHLNEGGEVDYGLDRDHVAQPSEAWQQGEE